MTSGNYLIVCDDIREEVGGKKSLIGVYNNEIVCDELPATLSQLCIRACVSTSSNKPFEKLFFEISLPNQSPIKLACPPETLESTKAETSGDNSEGFSYVMDMVAAPFQLMAEGKLVVSAFVNNRKRKIGSIRIRKRIAETDTAPRKKLKKA